MSITGQEMVELDDRRRASFGKLGGNHQRFLVTEEADGTLIFQPAVLVSELELAYLRNPKLVEQIEDNRAHPERLRPRQRRNPQSN